MSRRFRTDLATGLTEEGSEGRVSSAVQTGSACGGTGTSEVKEPTDFLFLWGLDYFTRSFSYLIEGEAQQVR